MFTLASPWLLLFLPLPWFIQRFLPSLKAQSEQPALCMPYALALYRLYQKNHQQLSHPLPTTRLLWLIWGLFLFALSGPQWLGPPLSLPREGRSILLAVDLSGSMQIPDMEWQGEQVNRLTVVKKIAERFIQTRIGDQIGLIVFGSRAYLQTPFTFDRHTVEENLKDASIGLAGPQTAIGDAIGLAIKRLMKQPQQSRILILLTDGVNNTGNVLPEKAAEIAAQQHIRIYTIGIGSDQLNMLGIFGMNEVNPSSDLDIKTLKDIAKKTGGMFFRAKNTEGLAKAYQSIDQLEPVASQNSSTVHMVTPLYPWPLALGLILLLYVLTANDCKKAKA